MRQLPIALWLLTSMSYQTSGYLGTGSPELQARAASLSTGQAKSASRNETPEGNQVRLVGRGVVVESVATGSALEKAGLQPGDVILRWHRFPNPPANPAEASGVVNTPFDWWEVEVEQAQRGRLLLTGQRGSADLALSVELGEWSAVVRPQLSAEGLEVYSRIKSALREGNTAAVLRLWSSYEQKPGAKEKRLVRAWLLYWMAGEELQREDPASALRMIGLALDRETASTVRAVLLEREGEILEQEGEPQKAEVKLLESLRLRSSAGSSLAQAMIHSRLGTFFLYQGELNRAEEHYRAAMDLRAKLAPGSMDFASSINNLGILALERQNFDAALRSFTQALEIRSLLAPESAAEGESLYNVGIALGEKGAEEQAESAFRHALSLFERIEPKGVKVAMTLNCLGISYLDRQDLALARFHFERSLELLKVVAPLSLDTADTLTNLGYLAFQEKNLDLAERHFKAALKIQRKVSPGGRAVANNLNDLGLVLGERGEFVRSLAAHQEALQVLARIAPDGSEVASNLYNIAILYAEKRNFPKAVGYLERSLSIREKLIPDSWMLAETYATRGKVARQAGDRLSAEAWYVKAVNVFERHLQFLGIARAGTVLLRTSKEEIYGGALFLAAKRGEARRVLELLEGYRGSELAEMISTRKDAVLTRLPQERALKLQALEKKYEEISLNLEGLTGPDRFEKSGSLSAALSEVQRLYSEAIESARGQGESAFEFRYPSRFESSDLAAVLGPGRGMLYFFIVEGEVWSLLVLDDQRLVLGKVAASAKFIEERISRLRALTQSDLDNSAFGTFQAASRERVAKELYDLLIGPIEKHLTPLTALAISPEGPLHLLPWSSLVRTDSREGKAQSQYLADWKVIHLFLSAEVDRELQRKRPRAGESRNGLKVVAFADPNASSDLESGSSGSVGKRSSARVQERDWPRLHFSVQEVEKVARLFPGGRISLYIGREASEEHAKALGTDVRIIHFAMHAALNDRFPLNSALVLSRPDPLSGTLENGLLQVWEIFERVRLNADLVVLSACETGLGEEQGGEGLLGLARAFQYAGARSVLASLWSVDDQATSELMVRFYKYFLAGLPKDRALQAAQEELIAGPIEVINEKGEREIRDFRAPYYWAGFQLYGDWQ